MSTSKAQNNKLAVTVAASSRYKIQKNGVIKKLMSTGKYRAIGTERHGYNVITVGGKKIVTARILAAKEYLQRGYSPQQIVTILNNKVVVRRNGKSLDDRKANLAAVNSTASIRKETTKRLTQKQIDRMVELFFDGYSVAKIARRFRRKISRSHISRIIRKELGIQTVGA